MENFLNTSFSNSNANLSRPKTMKEKPNWEVKANLLLTPGWCAWTGWNTVRLWWEGGFEGGWESVGRSAGVSALRWVVLPWEGCVALPSAPQGSLLVSLQGLWHGGRGARVCVCERACVRAVMRRGARLHWGGRIPSGLVGNQRHWYVVSSAVFRAGKRESWVGFFCWVGVTVPFWKDLISHGYSRLFCIELLWLCEDELSVGLAQCFRS